MTLGNGDFTHWRETFKNNWQTSLPQPSWYYSLSPIPFIITFLFLDIDLCSHDSTIFLQIILTWIFLTFICLSPYICHQSAIFVLNIYRPNVSLSPVNPSFPFLKELTSCGISSSDITLLTALKVSSFQFMVFLFANQRRSPLWVSNYTPVA